MVRKVVITTGCRLHFTLIDMNADLGRVDGGVGVGLKTPGWRVEVSKGRIWEVDNVATKIVETIKEKLPMSGKFKIKVTRKVPMHVGLGSQTQLSLAVAKGISMFQKKDRDVRDLARTVGRGGTSGIGVTVFEQGGLVLDGGHRYREKGGFLPSRYSRAGPPPVLARYKVPRDWYFIIALPSGKRVYGADEAKAFKDHTPIPRKDVGIISRLVLLKMLPALVENDIDSFGESITRIQDFGFKKIENRMQGKDIFLLRKYMRSGGATGSGLTSFGPATFCVIRGRKNAEGLASKLKRYLKRKGGEKVFISQASEKGAEIKSY